MNFMTASRLTVKKPRWLIANLVETTQAATDNVLKGYDRGKKTKGELEKKLKTEIAPSKRDEHSFTGVNVPSKVDRLQRDVFGATILPSNLSFDNMKKLSMKQIKLEDIPFVDENNVAEVLIAEKMTKTKEAEKTKSQTGEDGMKKDDSDDCDIHTLLVPFPREDNAKVYQEFCKADPFEQIPGPRFFETTTGIMRVLTRHVTVYFILKLLGSGYLNALRRYGSIVKLPEICGGKILIVSRADHISAVNDQDKRNPVSSCLETIEYSRLRRHGKKRRGCVISEIEWEETKKAIDDVLQKDEEKYFDYLEDNGGQLLRKIRNLKNRENEVPEDFILEINKWSLECLVQILFDKNFGFLDSERMKWPSKNALLFKSLRNATECAELCENSLQLWRFMKTSSSAALDSACVTIEEILSEHVYESQMNLLSKDDDLKVDALTFTEGLLLQDGMTKHDVITNLLDILLIGMNTMSSAMAFLLYHLSANPKAQNELFKEIKASMPEKYSRLEYDQLSSLRYLHACLKESLRLKMPMPIAMKALKRDVVLSNFQVPRGTYVLMASQMEALKEENFDGAREFRPERWLDPENKHPFTTLPLGVSSTSNFETRLAELSVLTCVAQIVRNFTVEYHYPSLSGTSATLSCPKTPLKFSFFERDS